MLSIQVYATDSDSLEGIFHEDGSYQFGEEELARLNEFLRNNKLEKANSLSVADVVAFASPGSYDLLSQEQKNALANELWYESVASAYPETRNLTYDTTISAYGNSVKGYAFISRPSADWLTAICAVAEYPNQEEYVGYSYNIAEPENDGGKVSFCSATVVIDPPSGTYWAIGQFAIPYLVGTVEHINTVRRVSDTMSYVNPYN